MTGRPPLPEGIRTGRVVAVSRGVPVARLLEAADVLAAHGLHVVEVTMDSPGAAEAIEQLAARGCTVGAGTVRSVRAAADAVAAGAGFLVSPHTDAALVGWAARRDLPFLPGAFTPTEVAVGWGAGAAAVKVFPASVAGPAFVRELRGPFPDVPLVPSGGVTLESARAFLRSGAAAVCLGGWLVGAGPADLADRAGQVAALVAGMSGQLSGEPGTLG